MQDSAFYSGCPTSGASSATDQSLTLLVILGYGLRCWFPQSHWQSVFPVFPCPTYELCLLNLCIWGCFSGHSLLWVSGRLSGKYLVGAEPLSCTWFASLSRWWPLQSSDSWHSLWDEVEGWWRMVHCRDSAPHSIPPGLSRGLLTHPARQATPTYARRARSGGGSYSRSHTAFPYPLDLTCQAWSRRHTAAQYRPSALPRGSRVARAPRPWHGGCGRTRRDQGHPHLRLRLRWGRASCVTPHSPCPALRTCSAPCLPSGPHAARQALRFSSSRGIPVGQAWYPSPIRPALRHAPA